MERKNAKAYLYETTLNLALCCITVFGSVFLRLPEENRDDLHISLFFNVSSKQAETPNSVLLPRGK